MEWFFLLIASILGLIFATIGLREVAVHFSAGSWIPTQATVLSAGVEESTRADRSMSTFSIWLVYEYSYKGQVYKSSKTYLSQRSHFGSSDAKQFLLDWPSGSKRTIWVSDKFPQKSTPEQFTWILWGLGGVFGFMLICFSMYIFLLTN